MWVVIHKLGRGVFAESDIFKGDFILEYRGDLIDPEESKRRRRIYHNSLKGFMFDFIWHGKFWTIDAARDDGTLGRLVNDDHINPNCKMKRIMVEGKPHLCLFALKDITPGDEIRYNYGDADCPWRNQEERSGMEGASNCPRSENASEKDLHYTQSSLDNCTLNNQETISGVDRANIFPKSDGTSEDIQHSTDCSQVETFHIQETISGTNQASNCPKSDGASEDNQHCTDSPQHDSIFHIQETIKGMNQASNCPKSDGASEDNQHCTDSPQHDSIFHIQETIKGTNQASNCPKSDGASEDNQHCTDNSQHDSIFHIQV
uniref:SET domain-containing protein n=1 Tax=Denticeps clupeoides TaxID=299321 RepID=A0AAY4D583_9TELE